MTAHPTADVQALVAEARRAPDIRILSPLKRLTARKHHVCDCWRRDCTNIAPGDRYECTTFLEDGKFTVFRIHADHISTPVRYHEGRDDN